MIQLIENLRRRWAKGPAAANTEIVATAKKPALSAGTIPDDLVVCSKPEDMPRAERVISGTTKNFDVKLRQAEADHVVVLKDGPAVIILISVAIYRTEQAKRLFADIREQLGTKYERERTIWATPDIVEGARNRKPNATASGDTIATSQTKFAAEFAEWLQYGLKHRATDLHVQRRGDVAHLRFRIDGKLEDMENGREGQILGQHAMQVCAHVYDKLNDKDSNTSSAFNERSYSSCTATYDLGDKKLNLRCQVLPTNDGFDFIARFRVEVDRAVEAPRYTIRNMGYTKSQVAMIERAMGGMRGLIIVAGIPNSAKTTLVETILNNLENRDQFKLVTLDDPVEFKVYGASHATINAVPGDPVESAKLYTQAVESWLRGNLDVLSAGEIRNSASGNTAITAARVGVLGLGTIHANSFMGIYERLTDPEIGVSMRALTSDGIVALGVYQHLVPMLCQECATKADTAPLPLRKKVKLLGERFNVKTDRIRFKGGYINGQACPSCRGKGVVGQKVVAEMFEPNSHERFQRFMRSGDDFKAREVWRSLSDGQFDSDNMDGKPVFLHALKDALDGKIDLRACERFGSIETFDVDAFKRPEGAAKLVSAA